MTEKKLIKAAKKIKEYCDSQARCDDCVFVKRSKGSLWNGRCDIAERTPAFWPIPGGGQ